MVPIRLYNVTDIQEFDYFDVATPAIMRSFLMVRLLCVCDCALAPHTLLLVLWVLDY